MNNLTLFYHIVPKGSGCSYLAKDDNGNHIILKKIGMPNISLIFPTAEAAQEYIDKYLDNTYVPEHIGLNPKFFNLNEVAANEPTI